MQNIGTSSEQTASGQHVSLSVDKLGRLKNRCSIYRVPEQLQELKEKAFSPRVISIGPIHHGRKELKEMEDEKKVYLEDFLELSQVSEAEFVAAIKKRETRLRGCYEENFGNLSSKEFVDMVLLDSSFVIMFLLRLYSGSVDGLSTSIDNIFRKPWMGGEIKFDLCLLENQLPFFILQDLFNIMQRHTDTECSMIRLTHEFLRDAWDMWVPDDILEQIDCSKVVHFVDFLTICQLPTQWPQPKKHATPPRKLGTQRVPTVAELHGVGIKFELGASKNLLDIKFDGHKGILAIPKLKISEPTKILFRNLQVFEQCKYGVGYVCDYITMVCLLVRATKDVNILVDHGIIEHSLRDNYALSRLLKELGTRNYLPINRFYFAGVVEELKKYYDERKVYNNKRRHRWMADLYHKYFNSPWTIISVLAATVLLILTVIQTVCSVLQV